MSGRRPRAAVVDDDRAVRELVVRALSGAGADVDAYASGREFLDRARPESYDLILCDLVMPEMDGVEVLGALRGRPALPDIVVLTGAGSVPMAVAAMREGAKDVLTKPFDVPSLLRKLRDAVERRGGEGGHAGPAPPSGLPDFVVGASPAWTALLARVRRAADADAPVLVQGETGAGKDVIARLVGTWGKRAGKPFVSLNASALPENLVESELFGHARGAFSGATQPRRGLFEEASGGSLLLDDVDATPLPVQAKLLRALEEGAVRRVGENKPIPVDVRFVSATNADLRAAIAERRFRQDLFYRLAGITLVLPPLRERREDVLPLAEHFLRLAAGDRTPHRLSPSARDALLAYSFPGNVRELKHLLEQAVAFADGPEIAASDLSFHGEPAAAAAPSEELTDEAVAEALAKARGNRVEAARLLGVARSTLYRHLGKKERAPDDSGAR